MSKRLEETKMSRRDVLGKISLVGSLAAVGAVLVNSLRLVKPRLLPEASSTFSIGHPEEYPAGSVELIAKRNLLVVSTQQGVGAISMICTHLGCVVQQEENGFKCPCHGSKFDSNGKVLSGPAPGPLPWMAVSRRADGKLVVDSNSHVVPGTFFQA